MGGFVFYFFVIMNESNARMEAIEWHMAVKHMVTNHVNRVPLIVGSSLLHDTQLNVGLITTVRHKTPILMKLFLCLTQYGLG